MLIGGVRRLRSLALLATTVQFVVSAFVPAIHTYLHERPTPGASFETPILGAESRDRHGLGPGDVCLICQAQPGVPRPIAEFLQRLPDVSAPPLVGGLAGAPLSVLPGPNRSRAPPRH